ncbi:MAG: glycosyltransferase family 4 protein [Verrucomicrobiales bacterium]|nr:glycosyltransferase family 4 protein [Verrucomicrobiales bacterium]
MKIVFSNYDSPGNPWYDGGGARAVQAVASRLADRHTVRYVSGTFPGAPGGPEKGVARLRIGFAWAGPKLGQLFFQFLLPWCVRRLDFDVWVESLTPPFSTACLQRFTRRPVVALTQVLAGRGMTRKYRLPFATIERWGLRQYRNFIATSEHLRDELRRLNPNAQIAVIPNGVEGRLVREGRHDRDRHVLFLGRFDIAQKGIDLLLDAVAQGPPLRLPLIMAGAGVPADEAWIRRRIQDLGLQDRVQLPGRVEGEERLRLFREAACLVLPSRFEASPLVLAEAFCFALPVVMFDIPELKGLPSTCCLKVPLPDPMLFGAALRRLLADAACRQVMGRAARQESRRYDWDDLAAQYEAFLQSVTGS